MTLSLGGEVLMFVGGVQVRAGEMTEDPRLTPITLETALRTIEVTHSFAPGARPTSTTSLDVKGPGGWQRVVAIEHKPQRTLMVTVHGGVDLRMSVDGCQTAYLSNVSTDQVIELAPGFPVELEVFGLPPFHGTPQWQLTLTHKLSGLSVDCDIEDSRGKVVVGESGTYVARLSYARHGSWMSFRQGADVGEVEVGNHDGNQSMGIRVPGDYMDIVR